METKLSSQQILPILIFASGLLTMSIASNTFLVFGQQQKQFSSKLTGENEVPPINTTATGLANFTVSPDGQSLHYTLSVQHISGVMGAHIHVGTSTQDGPILISLFNSSTPAHVTSNMNGLLVKGTVTSSDIKGNLTGKLVMPHVGMNVSSIPELTNLFTSGNAYVNVHTQQHQNGEIRGQVGPSSNTTAVPSTSNMTLTPPSNTTAHIHLLT